MTDRARTRAWFRLPDGRLVEAGPDAIVGRSPVAAVRLEDARLSTVHAELSNRPEGLKLIARGGRIRVLGRAVREALLVPGLAIDLAPGLTVVVESVERDAEEVVPPTAGREHLVLRQCADEVRIHRGLDGDPVVVLAGVSARIVDLLLEAGDTGARWGELAEAVWPDEGALRRRLRESGRVGDDDWTEVDERRLRNRWDQAIRLLRRSIEPVRGGTLLDLEGGMLRLRLGPGDGVVRERQD